MKFFFVMLFFFISSTVFSQEVGSIIKEQYSIKLFKTVSNYSLTYSDISTKNENTIHFQNKETVYNILMNGFKSSTNHLVIIKTANDTIVNLEFINTLGKKMLKIRQNNLSTNTSGTSSFFSIDEIITVFGNP
jgi:hypothetical protein